jgi:hypothetical protein
MKKSLALVFVAACALLAACGPKVSVTPLNPSPRPFTPRNPMAVEIFTTGLPPRPYVEVAALSAKGGDAEEHVPKMREEAGKLGCDALVFTTMPRDATATGYNWRTGGVTSTSANSGSTATCVVWTTGGSGGPGPGPH